MTIKGKKAKQDIKWREISPDIQVYGYLRDKVEFDTGIWYEYAHDDGIKGFLLLPYKNGYWLEDKLWFESQLKLNQFCMMCNCKVVIESD